MAWRGQQRGFHSLLCIGAALWAFYLGLVDQPGSRASPLFVLFGVALLGLAPLVAPIESWSGALPLRIIGGLIMLIGLIGIVHLYVTAEATQP